MEQTAKPTVILYHQRGLDQVTGERTRATCATCGWVAPRARLQRGGWVHTDWANHVDDEYELAMTEVWNGRATPVKG